MLTDSQINDAKAKAPVRLERHHEHNDCVRIAYEWLDAQQKIKGVISSPFPLKHMVERWGGRYVSQSDVEVAAWLHPDIQGTYPRYNISKRLTLPSDSRLSNIGEAFSQDQRERLEDDEDDYKRKESSVI